MCDDGGQFKKLKGQGQGKDCRQNKQQIEDMVQQYKQRRFGKQELSSNSYYPHRQCSVRQNVLKQTIVEKNVVNDSYYEKGLPMVRIILSLENEKPQTYNFVRYATRYLSAIRSDVYQTESGIVHLTQSCELGLKHNDPIIVLGRVIAAGKIEGVIRKIDSLEVFYRMHNEIAGINDDRDNRGERHAKRERVAHMVQKMSLYESFQQKYQKFQQKK